MKFATALRLVALAATAGLGGGFLWGVADHRSDEAVMNFVDQHIVLPETEGDAWLVFSCGSSERLVAYDLLNDEVLKNNEQIRIRMSNSSNRIFGRNIFSHYTAYAAEAFGVMFNFKDELKLWKSSRSSPELALIAGVLIPTGFLGYLASDWLRLECGSKTIYDRLTEKKFWSPHRLDAAKVLFDRMAYCIDRHVTLQPDPKSALLGEQLEGRDFQQASKDAIDQWREYISVANQGLPEQSLVESRYRKRWSEAYHRKGEMQEAEATWGDSFYQRLYGEESFQLADADFDKSDFRLILSADRKCNQLDRDTAKHLYSKLEPSIKQSKSATDKDFFDRRARIVGLVLKNLIQPPEAELP